MFPESSTWRADVVRVTDDGRRVPVELPWSGYRWDELVHNRGLRYPSVRHHADAGLDNQLAFLEEALDWVARNTPRDRETRYLEARVTSWHNDDPPRGRAHSQPTSAGARIERHRGRRPARAKGLVDRFDALLGRRVSMRGLALLRVLTGPVVLLHLRPSSPTASTVTSTATLSTTPTPPGIPSCPRLPTSRCSGSPRSLPSPMSRRLPHAPRHRRRRSRSSPTTSSSRPPTSTTTAPTCSSSWESSRSRPPAASSPSTRGSAAGREGRRGTIRPRLAALAAPLRVLRDLRRIRPQQARRPRLVRRHRHLAARHPGPRRPRARCPTGPCPSSPTAPSTPEPPSSSCSPSSSSRWRCGAAGTRYAAVWVAVVFHLSIEASASVQVFSFLAIAVLVVWAVPSTRDRVLRFDPTDERQRRLAALVRALDWLARFRVEPATPGSRLEVVDRDGTAIPARRPLAFTLSRLPLTAWFALPTLLLPAVRRARRMAMTGR